MRIFVAFLLGLAALHGAEYPMVSNMVARPLLQVSNAVERFAAYTGTNATTFGDWGVILSRSAFTNRFGELGVQFFYNCCAFSPPAFHIQVTSLSSNKTRLEICAHPMFATAFPANAFNERHIWAANRIMTNVVEKLEKGP
jgi:hypothetical protein